MTNRNETPARTCRFLNDYDFQKLYEAFIEAFSDYVIPFALTETQFHNHINLNGVDLNRSVGCFEGEHLIGFSLNGFGQWDNKTTVYDAGTAVIHDFRRQGISSAMFDIMTSKFQQEHVEQWLLEVITTNTAAVNLYRKLGFRAIRELAVLQFDGQVTAPKEISQDLEIRDIDNPDWNLLTTFWDGKTSWQNSVAAIERSRQMKRIVGAYLYGNCVGYIISSLSSGRVAQIAVDKDHRNRGIGTALMFAVQAATAADCSLQIINTDTSINSAMDFFRGLGFNELITQFEMKRNL